MVYAIIVVRKDIGLKIVIKEEIKKRKMSRKAS